MHARLEWGCRRWRGVGAVPMTTLPTIENSKFWPITAGQRHLDPYFLRVPLLIENLQNRPISGTIHVSDISLAAQPPPLAALLLLCTKHRKTLYNATHTTTSNQIAVIELSCVCHVQQRTLNSNPKMRGFVPTTQGTRTS